MKHLRILLAEDDADDQQFFIHFVNDREDVELLPIAENGILLISQLEAITDTADLPNLVILDHNMPKMNGLQTLRALQADARFAQIPVVIYSTYTDEALTRAGLDAGARHVLGKPFTKEGYQEMIGLLIETCA